MKTMVSTAGSGLPGALEGPDVLAAGAKAGPWIVERELGRGGMGAVYAVVHEEIGKRAALKVVHKRLLASGFNTERMLLEAKVVNQVGHPNIVDIFETGKLADGRPYIVMERLDGQSLSARADAGKLLPDVVIAVLLQICDALIAAHTAGVIHRDLKLDNVFLVDNVDDPATPKIKLLDWGIAKLIKADVKVRHTVEGQLVGTPQYLSPEQARGHAVSPATDVYSLGVMAYELFLEQLPFEAETAAEVMAMHLRQAPPPPSDLWPDIPTALEDLLLAMLAKQAEHRPSALEVAHRLELVRKELDRRRALTAYAAVPAPAPAPRISSGPLRVVSSEGLAATQPAMWRGDARRWQYAIGIAALAVSGALFWISRDSDRSAIAATTSLPQLHQPPSSMATHGSLGPTDPRDPRDPADHALAPHADRAPSPAAGLVSARDGRDISARAPAARFARKPIEGSAPRVVVETAPEEMPPASAGVRRVDPVDEGPQGPKMALRDGSDAGPPAPARAELLSVATGSRSSGSAAIIPAALHTESPARAAGHAAPRAHPPAAPRRGAKLDPDGTIDVYR